MREKVKEETFEADISTGNVDVNACFRMRLDTSADL